MATKLFCVIQCGVYRHDIFGIYDDKAKAIAVAEELAKTDGDDYHAYDVIPFILNEDVPRERDFYCCPKGFHTAKEKKPIYSIRHDAKINRKA